MSDDSGGVTSLRATVLLAAVLVPAVIVTWAGRSTIGNVHRDARVVAELSPMPRAADAPVNFLVVGNDSRERIRGDAGDRFGAVDTTAGQRADMVMLVGFSSRDRDVRVLSLPRDLQLDVAGYGPQKLGTTLDLDGSRLLVQATKALTGLPIHHYVELDFVGFAGLIDSLGGVSMDFPTPARDVSSGLDVGAGPQRLDADAALAFVRSRNYETWRDGAWVAADDGDPGRIGRQHQFLEAVAGRAADGSILTMVGRLARLGSHVTVDARLSIGDMVRLAHRASSLRLTDQDLQTLPTEPVLSYEQRISPFPPLHVGGVGYERLVQPAAMEAISAFASSPARQS